MIGAIAQRGERADLSGRVMRLWLIGIVVLLPIELAKLPLNVDLADLWIILGLPIVWAFFLAGRRVIALSYAVPLWLIMLSSIVSAFAAPNPTLSVVTIMKEGFLSLWFLTMASVLAILGERDLRLILMVWLIVTLLHGLIIVAQFLSPPVWRTIASLAGRSTAAVHYRPSGLYANANKAALFQLVGFVPLLLVRPPRRVAMALGIVLFGTMVATGSMGALLAFVAGAAVALLAVSWIANLGHTIRMVVQLAIVLALIGGLVVVAVSQNEGYQQHLTRILLGRTERSSGSRFSLWDRGLSVYASHGAYLWGVGPENFRVVDGAGNQLHSDILAFLVERGLLGVLGLATFAALAVSRAILVLRAYIRRPGRGHLGLIVFVALLAAAGVESLTHQTFRLHDLWLALALQEATLHKLTEA